MNRKGKEIRGLAYAFAVLAVFIAGFLLCSPCAHAEQNEFPLKDGDTWVMAGDSITAQHLHSNYFEAFCYARFPKWTFHFRNSGVGGATITSTIARFPWDVKAWKPTIVSVELGMNDSGAGPDSVPAYIANMNKLLDYINKAGARPVLFTASPVNDGTTSRNLKGRNITIDKYSTALAELSAKQNIPFADQFHTLLDLWGNNKPLENMVRFADSVKLTVKNPDIPGREILNRWIDTWDKSGMQKKGINLTGDSIHPGPAGQMTMCAVLLQELNAPGLVSRATINCSGNTAVLAEEVNCRVTNLKLEKDVISFDRLDESLPMPVPNDCRTALVILPSMEDLSQWLITVKNIRAGDYDVTIDGIKVATVPSAALEKIWNMGFMDKGPVADQCRQILLLVSQKEQVVSQWRAKSKAVLTTTVPTDADKAAIEQLLKQVLDADVRIRESAQPKVHHFVIAPARSGI